MTTEEAIKILDDGDWWDYLDDYIPEEIRNKLVGAIDIADAVLRTKQERENPKPLTLDELREMDGEPVYLLDDVWAIIKYDICDILLVFNDGSACEAKLWYEKVGHAYRHKPKEETT